MPISAFKMKPEITPTTINQLGILRIFKSQNADMETIAMVIKSNSVNCLKHFY